MSGDRTLRAGVLAAVALAPLLALGRGYLPNDDALRHAAKAVSGRPWNEILVLRPDMTGDAHPGWHALLGFVHATTGASALDLVLLSVVGLFCAVSLAPILLLRRPEAWLLALVALSITDAASWFRLLSGRPLLVSAAATVVACLLARALDAPPWPRTLLLGGTALLAAATWMHGSPYLLALPVAAFALARRAWATLVLGLVTLAGVALGALLTGEPIGFLAQSVRHAFLALGHAEPTSVLALEFQPQQGAPLFLGVLALALVARSLRGRGVSDLARDPAFVLTALAWVLGFVAVRFWSDWGVPAALVFLAREIEDSLGPGAATRRGLQTAAIAVGCVLVLGSDGGGRYSRSVDRTFAPVAAAEAEWLPRPGGVLYSDSMLLFYQTFFRLPDAPWRYALGHEPGLMPSEDLAVYRQIRRARTPAAFEAWARRLGPADRLVLQAQGGAPPPIPGLEWHPLGADIWSGRLAP